MFFVVKYFMLTSIETLATHQLNKHSHNSMMNLIINCLAIVKIFMSMQHFGYGSFGGKVP